MVQAGVGLDQAPASCLNQAHRPAKYFGAVKFVLK
jgi:hypothetical protein